MCTTCGCSQDSHAEYTALNAPSSSTHEPHTHAHDEEAGHAHGTAHEHHDHHPHHHAHSSEHPDEIVHSNAEHATRTVRLEQEILAKNNRIAERNRGWFEGRAILACNLMSSPGSGKTTLLERTIRDLETELTIGVIEGDQASVRDAERIRNCGAPVVQINTGAGCHLDAEMVASAIRTLAPPIQSIVVIENVGNLVCPALFDLGERRKVVIMSVTEGDDKPIKYPHMFRAADLMLLNKIDLLPYVSFDVTRCCEYARQVNAGLQILHVSATRGEGMQNWYMWLREASGRPE